MKRIAVTYVIQKVPEIVAMPVAIFGHVQLVREMPKTTEQYVTLNADLAQSHTCTIAEIHIIHILELDN